MKVNSHNIEFGYELLSAIPYAYELFLKGQLKETVSGTASEPLYYFSPKHTVNPEPRSWFNMGKARGAGLPYVNIHSTELQPKVFPPYKQQFANDTYKWSKPTLCICNRANIEWEHSVINYFDEDILEWLFKNLKDHYEIIYFQIAIPKAIQDNGKPKFMFDDVTLARKHGATVFTDLLEGQGWNEVILRVFANCENYITMNGGYSILASYFAGQNIIYSKPGTPQTKELTTGAFWRYYPNINNVQTVHVPDYGQLKDKVQSLYIDKLPTANVIIRTSNRPNAFRRAINSVLRQDYKNINVIVTTDDNRSKEYTREYHSRCIHVQPPKPQQRPNDGRHYGTWFPANDYIAQAQARVQGYIFFLDDDDVFLDPAAISKVIKQMQPDKLAIWKVKFPAKIIPNGSFGIKPTLYDVTGIGLCYHSDMSHKSDWSPWKCADYRTAAMWGDNEIIWINQVLSGLQAEPGRGQRNDIIYSQKTNIMNMKGNVKVQFTRRYQDYTPGQVVELQAIVASNYIYRNFCFLIEDKPKEVEVKQDEPKKVITNVKDGVMGMQKQETPEYQTKIERPVRKTKKAKADEAKN